METYHKVEQYILNVPKFTSKNSLADTDKFYERLHRPGEGRTVIHIAGTNGKGSVCAYLQSVFMENGKKTAMFTSPHLVTMRERIRINNVNIPEEDFVKYFHTIMDKVECRREEKCHNKRYHPTFFELLFFIAMLYFEEMDADVIILETGMGGRLDATSVVKPSICGITEIGLDHVEYLGTTLEEIAFEKAGIIRESIPVVYTKKGNITDKVILSCAEKLGAKGIGVSKKDIFNLNFYKKFIDFSMQSEYYGYIGFTVSTCALYQVENAAIAFRILEELDKGQAISREQIIEGFKKTHWEGRMEEIEQDVFLDGAHNIDGIDAFLATVQQMGDTESVLLFAAVKDKAYEEMLRRIAKSGLFQTIILTQVGGERALEASFEKQILEKSNSCILEVWKDPEEALNRCRQIQHKDQKIFIAGSLYLAGAVKAFLG